MILVGRVYKHRLSDTSGYFMCLEKGKKVVVSPLFGYDDIQEFVYPLPQFEKDFEPYDERKTNFFAPVVMARYDMAKVRRWRYINAENKS